MAEGEVYQCTGGLYTNNPPSSAQCSALKGGSVANEKGERCFVPNLQGKSTPGERPVWPEKKFSQEAPHEQQAEDKPSVDKPSDIDEMTKDTGSLIMNLPRMLDSINKALE